MSQEITVTAIDDLPAESYPWGSIKWLCSQKLSPGAKQTLGICHILPGQQNPLHYHPNCEEQLYVVSGCGQHSFDEETVELKPGMTIRIPARVRHNLKNTGREPITCFISFSSGDRQTVMLE